MIYLAIVLLGIGIVLSFGCLYLVNTLPYRYPPRNPIWDRYEHPSKRKH